MRGQARYVTFYIKCRDFARERRDCRGRGGTDSPSYNTHGKLPITTNNVELLSMKLSSMQPKLILGGKIQRDSLRFCSLKVLYTYLKF